MLSHLFNRLINRIPSQCMVCRQWPSQPVCETCMACFAHPEPRCPTCALPMPTEGQICGHCVLAPPPLASCHAAVAYRYPWAGCITAFKFQQHPGWAQPLAHIMRQAPWADDLLQQVDLVLPLPLSAERLRQRGYNQAAELARHFAPGRVNTSLLLKLHDTPAQSGLSRSQRLRNLQGSLAVEPSAQAQVRHKAVLLIDDVMTTGATLHAAANVLHQAGAAAVHAAVLARTD